MEEIAFKYAVDHINRNRELLPDSRVMAQIERIPTHDSFYASKRGKIWFKFPTYHSQRDNKSEKLSWPGVKKLEIFEKKDENIWLQCATVSARAWLPCSVRPPPSLPTTSSPSVTARRSRTSRLAGTTELVQYGTSTPSTSSPTPPLLVR